MSLYEYSPISNADEIRLLILHGGRSAAIVECTLSHVSLAEAGSYEALSYTWGSDVLKPIILNQHVFHVRANLASALQHLRHSTTPRTLWVDALCINQGDVEERNLQVMRMGAVYQKASSVCAWLGPSDEDSDMAIALIGQMQTALGCENLLLEVNRGGRVDIDTLHRWQALSLLMARPWFSRRWVIQEIAFAANVVLQCGNKTVNWVMFSSAATFLGAHGREIAQILESVPLLGGSTAQKSRRSGDLSAQGASRLLLASTTAIQKDAVTGEVQRLRTLQDLVSLFPDFEVTDRRDVIYALIPLAKDAFNSKEWLPDYSKDFFDVWKQYVAYVGRETGSLDVICQPWAPPSAATPWWITSSLLKQTSKPGSMVRPHQKAGRSLFIGHVGGLKYRAGSDSRARFRISERVLLAVGIWIDRIAAIGEIAHEGKIPMEWRAIAIKSVQSHRSRPDLEQYFLPNEFCDTLVAGRGGNGEPTPPSFRRACDYIFGPSARKEVVDTVSKTTSDEALQVPDAADFIGRARSSTWNRRFIITKERRMGLVPPIAKPNDIICILLGCSVPIILRQDGQNFIMLGESYVNGLMSGEAMRGVETGLFTLQEFRIV